MHYPAPVISVAIVEPVPVKVPDTVCLAGKPKKEWWPVEPVLQPELRELLGRCLLTKDGDRGITRDQLNQERNQRYYGPDDQQENAEPSQESESFMLNVRAH
jgi:hypothetical protein